MVKKEHKDAENSAGITFSRRSSTPFPYSAIASSSELAPSVKELSVDIRLMKHTILEMQGSIQEIFSRIDGIAGRLRQERDGDSIDESVKVVLNPHETQLSSTVASASDPTNATSVEQRSLNVDDIAVELPYSQRPCETRSVPTTSSESLLFLPLVTTMQRMQRSSRNHRAVELRSLHQEVRKLDPIFMERVGAKTPLEYIVKAQRYVNVSIEDTETSSNRTLMLLQKVDKPWLLTPRDDVPSWDEQIREIVDFEKVIRLAVKGYFPLVEALSTLRSSNHSSLPTLQVRNYLSNKGVQYLVDLDERQWSQYCHNAAKLCNIQVTKFWDKISKIELLDSRRPFRTQKLNRQYRSLEGILKLPKTSGLKKDVRNDKSTGREVSTLLGENSKAKRRRFDTPIYPPNHISR